MATPERPIPHTSPTETDLRAVLSEIDMRLVLINEVESPLGRVFHRDRLLELRSEAETDLAELIERPSFSDVDTPEVGEL